MFTYNEQGKQGNMTKENIVRLAIVYLIAFMTLVSCQESTTSSEHLTLVGATTPLIITQTDSFDVLRDLKNVEDIKKEYSYVTSRIESSRMDSASFNYNCNDEKKGTVTYFTENGQLRIIKHAYNEYSHFSAVDNYFVKDSAPFFVLQRRLAWSFVDQQQTKNNVTENRVYIIDHKIVKCLQKKFTVYSNTKDAPQANIVANKEIKCSSLEPISKKFGLLLKYVNRREDLTCLGD
jgi:hypothetical protein